MFDEPKDWKEFFQTVFIDGPIVQHMKEDPKGNSLATWFASLEMHSAERLGPKSGRIIVKFPVLHEHLNPGGTLQGGLQAAMFDVISSWVFLYADGWASNHTSRTINMSYLRPAVEGEVLLMDCLLVQAGKRLGLSTGVLKREKDGAIISTCEHHKYNTSADKPRM